MRNSRGLVVRIAARLGLALGAALVGVVGAIWLARNLSQPLRDLVTSADRLARGDVAVKICALDRGDEVGEIARAVNVFRSNVTAQMSAETQASQQRRLSVEERQKYDTDQAEAGASAGRRHGGHRVGAETLGQW